MRSRVPWVIGSGLLIVAASGCGRERADSEHVEVPDRLTLYSIDGERDPDAPPPPGESFHDFPVLGQVVVEDPDRRQALIDAFNDGIGRSDGTVTKCFWPRHGIRAEKGGMIVDYAICFQCLQFATYRGDQVEQTPIARSPLATFNEELKRAGLPLAPSSFDKAYPSYGPHLAGHGTIPSDKSVCTEGASSWRNAAANDVTPPGRSSGVGPSESSSGAASPSVPSVRGRG